VDRYSLRCRELSSPSPCRFIPALHRFTDILAAANWNMTLRPGVSNRVREGNAVTNVKRCDHGAIVPGRNHVGQVSAREVVEDENVVAERQQRIDKVRADEPCAARNECLHAGVLPSARGRGHRVGRPLGASGKVPQSVRASNNACAARGERSAGPWAAHSANPPRPARVLRRSLPRGSLSPTLPARRGRAAQWTPHAAATLPDA